MLLDRYLIREISTSFVAVAVVLTVVFLAYSLTRYLTDAASGLFVAGEVARLTLYKSVIALEVLLPLAFYFGLIVGFGQLNLHNELIGMRASGMRYARLQRPLIVLGLLVAAAVAVLSTTVRPWAYGEIFALRDAADAAAELNRIKAQRFYLYAGNERMVYVEEIDRDSGDLRGVFIRTRTSDDIEVISAPQGKLEPFATPLRHRLTLTDASIFRSNVNARDFYGHFDSLTLALDAQSAIDHKYRTKAESTAALVLSADADDRAELQWRLSTPLSTFLLTLTALTLVKVRYQRGRFANFPAALAVYAVYYNLLGVARTWVEQGSASSIWWVPALLVVTLAIATLVARKRLT